MDIKRASGLILHPTALPSKYGIGDFGSSAYTLIDKLSESKTSLWQVLPLGITDEIEFSPYSSKSSVLGNPYLISLEEFEENIVDKQALEKLKNLSSNEVEYKKVYKEKDILLKELSKKFNINDPLVQNFLKKPLIKEHLVFITLSSVLGVNWLNWKDEFQNYSSDLFKHVITEYEEELKFNIFTQFQFDQQWYKLKEYANSKNVHILGDIPIYVNHNSADVWLNKNLFDLDENNSMSYVSGAVPDSFTKDGQIWGTALYDWEAHLNENYKYWIQKLNVQLEKYDFLRIDHFIGFFKFWAIPKGESALNGHWRDGPWKTFFDIVSKHVPFEKLLAEDLGVVLKETDTILQKYNIPGMLLLEQRIPNGDGTKEIHPKEWPTNVAAYTGTHDSQTIKQWFENANNIQIKSFLNYLETNNQKPTNNVWDFISLVWSTKCLIAITTVQDLLELDGSARFNIPGTQNNNWKWRLKSLKHLDEPLDALKNLNEKFKRIKT
jgi:4-alpha-glucanotransferase